MAARAGQSVGPVRVYPRGCGGTGYHIDQSPLDMGLSPAGAGEPPPAKSSPIRRRVYPRGCGGTGTVKPLEEMGRGLSPRVRGNQLWALDVARELGSIPAGTEPMVCGPPDGEGLPRPLGFRRQFGLPEAAGLPATGRPVERGERNDNPQQLPVAILLLFPLLTSACVTGDAHQAPGLSRAEVQEVARVEVATSAPESGLYFRRQSAGVNGIGCPNAYKAI